MPKGHQEGPKEHFTTKDMEKSFHHEGHEEDAFTTKDVKKSFHHEGHEEELSP
jgi:hypothetical protein